MILVTGSENYADLETLSGVLLDPITEVDFTKDVFTAHLVSDRIREVICELPVPSGGIGTTSDGRLLTEIDTKLLGVRQHAYARGSNTIEGIVSRVIENRIRLVTTSDIRGVVYPALLSPQQTSPPVATKVVISMEIDQICDLPEMRAFSVIEPTFTNNKECHVPVPLGTILPLRCISGKASFLAALEIVEELGENKFGAFIYHEADKGKPLPGDILEREVTRPNPANREQKLEFRAKIGTIIK